MDFKLVIRRGYRIWLFFKTLIVLPFVGRGTGPRVYFGGARGGEVGGPLVKVQRLKQFFPEHRWAFNLVYGLSNAPYMPGLSLKWLRRKKIPLVVNQNGVFYPGWFEGDWKRMNAIMAEGYHLADYVFWQSEFCRKSADHFLGARTGPGEVLYNAVDTELFKPQLKKEKRPFTFLITGKISDGLFYRLESCLRGLAKVRVGGLDFKLNISGWLSPQSELASKELVKSLRLDGSVNFLGGYNQGQAPGIYQGADAYVITKYMDPCPNVVLEAMACGLPVLYSSSGGVPELVGEKAGIGFAVKDDWSGEVQVPSVDSICQGMEKISKEATAMGLEARIRAVEKFDMAHWIQRHEEVFNTLLERNR